MIFTNNKKQNNKKSLKGGFTLIELLVTIVIFVIITGVVLLNSNKFDNTVLLKNFAYDVALTIKQAQSYGVNVRENVNSVGFNTKDQAYGIYFDGPQDNTKFVLFNDTVNSTLDNTPDKIYNGSLSSCPVEEPECIQKFSMTKGTRIDSLCTGKDEADCNANGRVDQLSILFYRPNLNAIIYSRSSGNPGLSDPKSYAKITLAAADGSKVSVVVTAVGQIYVKK